MLRKILILFLMATPLAASAATGASFPFVMLMFSLLLIALFGSTLRDEQQER
jgi:hypothetical protein